VTLIRRRRRDPAADRPGPQDPVDEAAAEQPPVALPDKSHGPWDVGEVGYVDDLVDLGGLLVPTPPGLELRAEVADDRVLAVTMVLGPSALQVQPFAAPRTFGIWDEVRIEIAAGITQQGGLVDEAEGPFGPELRAQVPVPLPGRQRGLQAARYLGVDGPRWFLRGVITGQAAVDPAAAGPIEEIFAGMVVVRGSDPMAPRDPIPLHLPDQPPSGTTRPAGQQRPDLDPFQRGPEITETR
jgi:hypothetical protein